jgi:hypothetical protein
MMFGHLQFFQYVDANTMLFLLTTSLGILGCFLSNKNLMCFHVLLNLNA